jgi:hypothetical protein
MPHVKSTSPILATSREVVFFALIGVPIGP